MCAFLDSMNRWLQEDCGAAAEAAAPQSRFVPAA
jgi:hypothetical protein